MVDWPRGAKDELVQWENNLRRRSGLVLDELVHVRVIWMIRMIRPLLQWWLGPICSGFGPLPQCRREGIPQWPNSKGDN